MANHAKSVIIVRAGMEHHDVVKGLRTVADVVRSSQSMEADVVFPGGVRAIAVVILSERDLLSLERVQERLLRFQTAFQHPHAVIVCSSTRTPSEVFTLQTSMTPGRLQFVLAAGADDAIKAVQDIVKVAKDTTKRGVQVRFLEQNAAANRSTETSMILFAKLTRAQDEVETLRILTTPGVNSVADVARCSLEDLLDSCPVNCETLTTLCDLLDARAET